MPKMKINYPSWATTVALKYCFLCCMEEVLLIIHNHKGRNVPLNEFRIWIGEWYNPRDKLIRKAKLTIREAWREKEEKDLPEYLKPGNVFT